MLAQFVVLGNAILVTSLLQDDSFVNLTNGDGQIRGLVTGRWRSFRGIPFAKPPLGSLRFLPPERNEPWVPQVLDATDFKPNCAQTYVRGYPDWDGYNLTIDEDCLYLNVFTPGKHTSVAQRQAVGVFIYGGGHYTGGANDEQLYAWHTAAETGMIFVTFNYRLGAFGWMGSQALRALAKDGSTGNAGFLDQRLSLKWVQENIQAFNGDPSRILLFGESSGAADVSSHMAAPGSQGLFTRAMMQSGGFTSWSYKTMQKSQVNYDYFLNITGCSNSRPFDVQCLQAIPWWTLGKLTDKHYTDFPYPDGWSNSSFAATIDGVVLVAPTDILGMQGKVSSVPVLIGTNDNEGVAFVSNTQTKQNYMSMSMSERQYITWTHRNFPEPFASKILQRYTVNDFTPFFSASHVVGDLVIRCPTHRAMQYLTIPRSGGEEAAVTAPVFGYVYTHSPVSKMLHSGDPCAWGAQGAFHGAEIPFFLDIREFFATSHETALGKNMSQYLRNFAWSGNPNEAPPNQTSNIPHWPQFANSTKNVQHLGTNPDGNITTAAGRLSYECELMDEYWRAGQPTPLARLDCVDDDMTADENGNNCLYYDTRSEDCGKFNTDEFFAGQQCCACKRRGEADASVSARVPPPTLPITVSLPNGDGSIRGHGTKRWRSFRGIPFAKPPFGSLRFMPPEQNLPWRPQTLDTLDFKPNCMQSNYIKSWQANNVGLNGTYNEDCLYLNVFAPGPPKNASRRFPVLVYFNDFGGASDAGKDLWKTAAVSKMVCVTFNYRLGVFGFLGSQELKKYAKDGSTGNAGLLDQRMVLEWVQKNIEAFHGDPHRVLILGGDGGAAHVSSHLVSPGSQGFFQRAMMSSGAFRAGGQQEMHKAQANFDFISEKSGCRATGSKVVECLQSINATNFANFLAYHPSNKGYVGELPFPSGWGNESWTATIDGVTLTARADVLAREGKAAKVPVILGSSHNAGTSIATECRTCKKYIPMTLGEKRYVRWAKANFPEEWSETVLSTYSLDHHTPFWAASSALTDYIFKCPTQRAARFLSQPAGPNVFEYNFVVDPVGVKVRPTENGGYKGTPCSPGSQGVAVGFDVLFFLNAGETKSLATQYEKDTALALLLYLRNFAWSGDPNVYPPQTKKMPIVSVHWPAFSNRTHQKLWIGTPSEGNITVQNDTRGLSCRLWQAYWDAGEPLPRDDSSTSESHISEVSFFV